MNIYHRKAAEVTESDLFKELFLQDPYPVKELFRLASKSIESEDEDEED